MVENDLQLWVAQAMRRRREGLAISQEAFADRVGLHRTYYSSIERGERNVSLKNLGVIAKGLDIPLSKLIAEAETRARPKRDVSAKPRLRRSSTS
jgi:transcriptional regulator with XRE-family HTH domain